MTYRDDLGALRTRLTNLEQEQADLRDKKRALETASSRLEDVDAELSSVRSRFAKERHLPLLDRVTIASPCPANWDDMVGDERVRFCGKCTKNVYNVVELTRDEAEDIIREHEGDVCMRLYQRKDGTVITADCPVGRKRKRRRRLFAGVVLTASAGLGMTMYGATATMGEPVMGEPMVGLMVAPTPTEETDEDYSIVAGGITARPSAPPPMPSNSAPPRGARVKPPAPAKAPAPVK